MRRVVLLLVGVVLVNLPLAHSAYVDHRIDTAGHDETATVKSHEVVRGHYFVRYRVPGSDDVYSARVGREAYDAAIDAGSIRARVVPGHPNQNRVAGEIGSHAFVVLAVIGDLFLLGAVIALVLVRRRRRRRVVVFAETDVVPCDGGPARTDLEGGRVQVHGIVVDVGPGWVDLQVHQEQTFHVVTGRELRCRADLRQIASVTGLLDDGAAGRPADRLR